MRIEVGKAQAATFCALTFVQADKKDDQAPQTEIVKSLFEHLMPTFFIRFFAVVISRVGYFFFLNSKLNLRDFGVVLYIHFLKDCFAPEVQIKKKTCSASLKEVLFDKGHIIT